jgi:hypothetical protein
MGSCRRTSALGIRFLLEVFRGYRNVGQHTTMYSPIREMTVAIPDTVDTVLGTPSLLCTLR